VVAQSYPDVVIKVYYPKESASNATVMRADPPGVAHGGLMSIVLHLHASCKRAFFLSSSSSKTAAIRIRLIGAKSSVQDSWCKIRLYKSRIKKSVQEAVAVLIAHAAIHTDDRRGQKQHYCHTVAHRQ
jgi:hypothetical protein